MTKSPRQNVPDVGIELGAAYMPSGHASDRATAPGNLVGCALFVLTTASSFRKANNTNIVKAISSENLCPVIFHWLIRLNITFKHLNF